MVTTMMDNLRLTSIMVLEKWFCRIALIKESFTMASTTSRMTLVILLFNLATTTVLFSANIVEQRTITYHMERDRSISATKRASRANLYTVNKSVTLEFN